MKLKNIFVMLIIVVVLCTTACNSENILKEDNLSSTGKSENIQAISLMLEKNVDCTLIAANTECMFYVVSEQLDYSNYDKKAQIKKVDLVDRAEEIIYEYKDIKGFYFSELKAADDFIVWESINDEKLTINKMDLKTKDITKIYESYHPEVPILLSLSDKNVLWYDQTTKQTTIKILNTETGAIRQINNVKINTPYERVGINNNLIVYLLSDKSTENKLMMVVYDIGNDKILKNIAADSDKKYMNLFANIRYITYMIANSETGYDLYAYDYINHKTIELNGDEDMYIFSYRMINDKVLINEKSNNDIISINISTGTKKNLTKKINRDKNFYMDDNYENIYYTLNQKEQPEVVYFKIGTDNYYA